MLKMHDQSHDRSLLNDVEDEAVIAVIDAERAVAGDRRKPFVEAVAQRGCDIPRFRPGTLWLFTVAAMG